jgi:uncharacterized integral membrane protein
MRLALPLLLILFVVLLFMFALTNDARVDVTLGGTTYRAVHLTIVVLVSLVVGVLFTGILALIEGASSRLENRRLRRTVEKLETETNFLRTQRAAELPRAEPDAVEEPAPTPRAVESEDDWRERKPPSAPVYDPDDPGESEA